MLHPRCSGFGLVAGLQEIFQRFSQMLGDLKSTSRPRIFDGLQVDHARFEASALGGMRIPLAGPTVDHTELHRPASSNQRQAGIGGDEAADMGHVSDAAGDTRFHRGQRPNEFQAEIEQGDEDDGPRSNKQKRKRDFIPWPAGEIGPQQTKGGS